MIITEEEIRTDSPLMIVPFPPLCFDLPSRKPPDGNPLRRHAAELRRKLELLQARGEPILPSNGVGNVVAVAQRTHGANLGVRPSRDGEPALEAVVQLLVGGGHGVLMAAVVLRDALAGEAGHGEAGRGLGDAEVALEDGLCLLDGLFLGRDADRRAVLLVAVVVVAAHEDEELRAGGFVSLSDANVGVEEDAQGALGVLLGGHGEGDEVAEAGGLEVCLGIPDVDGHDGDCARRAEAGDVIGDAGEVLGG